MKTIKKISLLSLLLVFFCAVASVAVAQRRQRGKRPPATASKPATTSDTANESTPPESDAAAAPAAGSATDGGGLEGELKAAMALPSPAERVARLEALVLANADSPLRSRAVELLTSARAALGDEQLRAGNIAGGIEQFRQAVAESPVEMPEKLFVEVISQLPSNLFLRGESVAALDLARRIEDKIKENPQRLLAVAAFYLSIEQGAEAARVAELAIKLAPELAAAHGALGLAHRIELRLDAAATEFARALELDSRSASARRNLADLRRAAGKSDEALVLYREQLIADPKDAGARAGMVLSLFDVGKREEAEKELQLALGEEARNVALMVGAAYWYAAHGEGTRALELAERAVRIEPRYTWAQVAFARALMAEKRPLDAERALRFARQYGRFPTLDYELANTLAAAGFYEEAAEELARTFIIKDGQIETQLAGRIPSRAATFIELLAPERRASIYQHTAADTEGNARMLKGLLAFHLATGAAETRAGTGNSSINEASAVSAARDFMAGGGDSSSRGSSDADEMRAFRQLFVAGRLLRRGVALPVVVETIEAAMSGVDRGLDSPVAAVAVLADSLREIRARAIAAGATTDIPAVPRNVLSNIMRGRIEDIAGWALFNQGKAAEAVVRLRRAASVLPENTLWWRDAMWHLGTALDASGNQAEALAVMMKGYDRQSPNPVRRALLEALYVRVNGSLNNFDAKLGAALSSPANASVSRVTAENTRAPLKSGTPVTESNKSAVSVASQESTSVTTTPAVESATLGRTESSSSIMTPAASQVASQPTSKPKTLIPPRAEDQATTSAPSPQTVGGENPRTPTNSIRARETSPAAEPPSVMSSTQRGVSSGCVLSVSENTLTIDKGGSAIVTLNFDEASGSSGSKIKAATADWSNIMVLAEPVSGTDANTLKFRIGSVGQAAGTFTVTFSSPCGKQEIIITVR